MTGILERDMERMEQVERDRVMFALGGINVISRASALFSTELMRGLIRIEEDKLYKPLGFETFVEFLQSDHSPVTKSQYYERKALLEKEGDALFDLLSDMGVAVRTRKRLGSGSVELNGETLFIHTDGETKEIAIDDRASMLETLSALADANVTKAAKIERQAKKIEEHGAVVDRLKGEVVRAKAVRAAEIASDSHAIARVELGLAMHKLAKIASDLSDIEKDQLRDSVLEDLAGQLSDLRLAYVTERSSIRVEPTLVGDTLEEALENYLGQIDLNADYSNEGELAAKL